MELVRNVKLRLQKVDQSLIKKNVSLWLLKIALRDLCNSTNRSISALVVQIRAPLLLMLKGIVFTRFHNI